jgi:hypothetical protein
MPQLTAPILPVIGIPGMLADNARKLAIVGYPCSEPIPAGRLCEVVNGVLRLCQTTGASLGNVVGVSVYIGLKESTSVFAVGDLVPVVRIGRVWAEWNGTTQTEYSVPNVNHSSTVATNRGMITDAATSAVAGSEVSPAPNPGVRIWRPGIATACIVEVNLP